MAKTKNDFDCVQMKRQIQARVAGETKGMTAEQRDAYIRERADAFAKKMGWIYESVPDEYYQTVWDRVSKMGWEIKEDHQRIRDLGILVDADDEGYLLQLFTKPLQDRPTLFFEIICRRGSQSFGKGNFKALLESLELEQARRGNL